MVMRSGAGMQDMGKAAVLPFDISPIQLGTTGTVSGMGFEVIGRVRWGWEDGSWNEWLLLGVDGAHRWLGEAMGQFMLLAEQDAAALEDEPFKSYVNGGTLNVGQAAPLGGITYLVADIKDATCIGSEGELPFATPPRWTVNSIDFRSDSGACASLQRDELGVSLYAGSYVELADLKPNYLREIEGWPMPRFA